VDDKNDLSHMTSKISADNTRGHKAERAAWFLAIFTGVVAIFTAALVVASFLTIREARRASSEQLGVRTWLYVDPKFNSNELKHARKHLAEQLDPYVPAKRAEVDDDTLNFFQSVGVLYKRDLLNKELAESSFSYWAVGYWEAAKVYIADERRAEHDESVYGEFEAFAKAMQKHKPSLSDADLKRFLAAEKALEIK
jgi:hypothetical protein